MAKFEPDYLDKCFKYCVDQRFRLVVVLIGEGTKKHIPALHSRLCKASSLQSLVWCYKNAETACNAVAKKQKLSDDDDALVRWIKTNSPEYIPYKESGRILGRTCDMLVLQDFEAITPNTSVTCMETVRGGGVIVLLLDQARSLSQLLEQRTDIHDQIGPCVEARFNWRFFRSLAATSHAVFLDHKMRVMDVTMPMAFAEPARAAPPSASRSGEIEEACAGSLVKLCRTEDQRKVLEACMQIADRGDDAVVSITAARGRGKSASLGLFIAHAVAQGLPSISVSALFPENVQTVFDLAVAGLQALGYRKAVDFKITYAFEGKKRTIGRIEMPKTKQYVEYLNPHERLFAVPSLLIVDEAASIPIDSIRNLLAARLVFMASTVGGYEGTGRIFKTRLLEFLKGGSCAEEHRLAGASGAKAARQRAYTSLELEEPIRYARGDPVEKWLDSALLLKATPSPLKENPPPSQCRLYHVNKGSLFAGSDETEHILRELFTTFAASHYRNSPDDLQILADAVSHELFALLSPSSRILCAVQVAFEGRVDRRAVRKEGNLVPWVLHENFGDEQILDELGVRVVRIAVHPSAHGMGYGTEALRQLIETLSASAAPSADSSTHGPFIVPKKPSVLFSQTTSVAIARAAWIGASFGLAEKLLGFWKKSGFVPLCIRQDVSKVTGLHPAVVLRSIEHNDAGSDSCAQYAMQARISGMNRLFTQRLVPLLAFSFRTFQPSLVLALIHAMERRSSLLSVGLSEDEAARLQLFARGVLTTRCVLDAIPTVARRFFLGADVSKLTVLQQSILLMVGCQHREPAEVCEALGLEEFQISAILSKVVALVNEDAVC
ncbi:N-acetyltransferase 10 [Pancytospora philotis]|nr:N-acetyltransferase 10 [Pancytospora philotis]